MLPLVQFCFILLPFDYSVSRSHLGLDVLSVLPMLSNCRSVLCQALLNVLMQVVANNYMTNDKSFFLYYC